MSLLDVRKKFVLLTGRYDLVTDLTTYANVDPIGANFFIQAGQRMLDRMSYGGRHHQVRWRTTLNQGEYLIQSSRLRAVKSVLVETTDEAYHLVKLPYGLLRDTYGGDATFASIDEGAPVHFSAVSVRDVDTPTTTTESQAGVLILPPADKSYTVEIDGLFTSVPLLLDADESFWTVAFPEILIQAAWYELERYYRNSQGMVDHMESIKQDLQGIDFDEVEESIAGLNTMQDSWQFG